VSSSEPNQCETIGRARVRRLQKFVTCAVEVENWGLGVNCLHYLKTLCGGLAVEHGILFRLKVEEMTVVFSFVLIETYEAEVHCSNSDLQYRGTSHNV
jgi:hypothetical protein